MAFRTALSGLDAASTDLEVTGHNIANADTSGFKMSRAEFADIYANSIMDVSTTATGRGVRVVKVTQMLSQGNVNFTGSNLDLAIAGEGFFALRESSGGIIYTRSGGFSMNRDGFVENAAGKTLQVYPAIDDAGTRFNTGTTTDLSIPTASGPPEATSEIEMGMNLDAEQNVPTLPFDRDEPTSYNHSTATTVYDSLGTSYIMTVYFRKTATPGEWQMFSDIADNNNVVTDLIDPLVGRTLTYDGGGRLITGAGDVDATGKVTLDTYTPTTGADPMVGMTMMIMDSTQFGSPFSVNEMAQNGFTAGQLNGVDIDKSGVVSARFTNGKSTSLGKIALGMFRNPQGLRKIGDTSWAQTFSSGDVRMGEPETSTFGSIQSGALENSNVDVAEQLVKLIIVQRNYQANAQVIKTSDAVTQTIINIR